LTMAASPYHIHVCMLWACCEQYLRLLSQEIPYVDIRIPHLQYESRVEYIWCSYTKMIIILRKETEKWSSSHHE
jgi:hypothetical protein